MRLEPLRQARSGRSPVQQTPRQHRAIRHLPPVSL